ncbi:MAG: Trm112 family protein [Nitrospirae bacterium]|nr:Trm112 family protein [Nitrospirota bacterium]
MMIDKDLLDILACPACKGDVELKEKKLVCIECGRRYPLRDDIPVMLIDEAEVSEDTP